MSGAICNPNCPENWVITRDQYVALATAFGLTDESKEDQ